MRLARRPGSGAQRAPQGSVRNKPPARKGYQRTGIQDPRSAWHRIPSLARGGLLKQTKGAQRVQAPSGIRASRQFQSEITDDLNRPGQAQKRAGAEAPARWHSTSSCCPRCRRNRPWRTWWWPPDSTRPSRPCAGRGPCNRPRRCARPWSRQRPRACQRPCP